MKRPSLSPCGASRAAQSRSIDEDNESSWKHRCSGAMLAWASLRFCQKSAVLDFDHLTSACG